MTKSERMKLAKILSQTAQESDAVALLSVRKAAQMVKASGETWQQVLAVEPLGFSPRPPVQPPLYRPPADVRARMQQGSGDAGDVIRQAFNRTASAFGRAMARELTRRPGRRGGSL